MEKFIDLLEVEMKKAFLESGYAKEYGKISHSNRPDLCEFQCNGAMAASKVYKKKPIDIAKEIIEKLDGNAIFSSVEAVMPGFINLKVSDQYLTEYLRKVIGKEEEKREKKAKIIIDYGGANVAKPLHVGHLRSAVIGEALKRLGLYLGYHMIGDVHLGDWGLQMGLIIEELRDRSPDLVYFNENFTGSYPSEAPFDIDDLEKIYPMASAKSKVDSSFKERAAKSTLLLQNGYVPYRAIWEHIMAVSKVDLKKNYDNLNVSFELWKGESDAQKYIPDMIEDLEKRGIAYLSDGALVVDIAKEGDSKELPPCIIRKSDGAALYATSDLGTLIEREALYQPDAYIYVADKRQELHYTQFFRVAKKSGIVPENIDLTFIGFGTVNGKDGKPFKTRDGGIMRLENLLLEVQAAVYQKISENRDIPKQEMKEIAKIVGLSAIKYGDLSNQSSKDYIFDMDRFISFEGNTGPYILYTIVRIQSILSKYIESLDLQKDKNIDILESYINYIDLQDLQESQSEVERRLKLELSRYKEILDNAWTELAPHKICQYIYAVANAFNSFYHDVKILNEKNKQKKISFLALIYITLKILKDCIWILGIDAPNKM